MKHKRYALLAGISSYPANQETHFPPLRCPINDVRALEKVLKRSGRFDMLSPLENPTRTVLEEKIDTVLRESTHNDFILFYFSCHGKLDDRKGRLHIATSDTIYEKLRITSLPISSLIEMIEGASWAQVCLILDCCFSGAIEKAIAKGSSPMDELNQFSDRGLYILTSSTSIEASFEKADDELSVLTKHILQALQGEEADLDNDGAISLDELYGFIANSVSKDSRQHPQRFIGKNPTGKSPILSYTGAELSGRNMIVRSKGIKNDHKAWEAITAELADRTFESMFSDEFSERMTSNVLFGVFIPRSNEWTQAGLLLECGVPLILLGPYTESEKFTKTLRDFGFRGNIGSLTYKIDDINKLRGAIHWVANYYHHTKELAVKDQERREKDREDAVLMGLANDVLQQAVGSSA